MLPQYQPPATEKTISARRKGVKQGALIMLIGCLLVPLLGVFSSFAPSPIGKAFEFFAAASAILCFVGGPLRILYAAIFEEGAPKYHFNIPPSYPIAAMPPPPARVAALPPQNVNPASQWRERPQTAEITPPTSVPDHTTRLLKNESEAE
jgi:hypothetical protein